MRLYFSHSKFPALVPFCSSLVIFWFFVLRNASAGRGTNDLSLMLYASLFHLFFVMNMLIPNYILLGSCVFQINTDLNISSALYDFLRWSNSYIVNRFFFLSFGFRNGSTWYFEYCERVVLKKSLSVMKKVYSYIVQISTASRGNAANSLGTNGFIAVPT